MMWNCSPTWRKPHRWRLCRTLPSRAHAACWGSQSPKREHEERAAERTKIQWVWQTLFLFFSPPPRIFLNSYDTGQDKFWQFYCFVVLVLWSYYLTVLLGFIAVTVLLFLLSVIVSVGPWIQDNFLLRETNKVTLHYLLIQTNKKVED